MPPASAARLRFGLCVVGGLVLGSYGLYRWPPFDDFKAWAPDPQHWIAVLDYMGAGLLLFAGPAFLHGWRKGRLTRAEPVPELNVLTIMSLAAGLLMILMGIGASRGILRGP